MQIKSVHYSAVINLGNYSNEKIGFTAEITESESVESVVEGLRQKVRESGGINADELYSTLEKRRRALEQLEKRIEKATQEWNSISEFLRTQGIKPDAVDMPKFTNLLPEIKTESINVNESEYVDEVEYVDDRF